MPKNLWDEIYVTFGRQWNPHLAFYEFYFTETVIEKCELTNCLKLLDWNKSIQEYHVWHLQYPNNNLDDILLNCEYFSDEFISRRFIWKFNTTKKHYEKIISVKNDSEKWFKALLEVGDNEFVMHNAEYRFGENINDKVLWKFYIDWLEKENDVQVS
uniref:Uncharacterized protein n=1 Tax=Panagrolaimus davidi TaxID=227884 RepID=A0A914P4L6_9BILA